MFAPSRHFKLIERPETRYPQIPFQECEINQIHRPALDFPYFIELFTYVYAPLHD